MNADLLRDHLAEYGEMKHWLKKLFLYLLHDEGPDEPDIRYWLTRRRMGNTISGFWYSFMGFHKLICLCILDRIIIVVVTVIPTHNIFDNSVYESIINFNFHVYKKPELI